MSTIKDSSRRKVVAPRQKEFRVKDRRATVDVLPDEVLLEVFELYLDGDYPWDDPALDAWHKLVHVCRRWRQVAFASPCRLNLRLLCTSRRSVQRLLDIWPSLPIVIKSDDIDSELDLGDIFNIDAALQYSDRVCEIAFRPATGLLLSSMEEPFPVLTDLGLSWTDAGEDAPVLPDSFLGGSVPRLRTLFLVGIPFPGLPKLLLSAHDLVYLYLLDIPDSGFISPKAMVTCLSSLTNLKDLVLGPRSHQTNRHRPPLTRTVLPSLTSLSFKGVSEYLEDLVARIDVPLLIHLIIVFFYQPIFDTPLLRSFIGRTEAFKGFHRADILFLYDLVEFTLLPDERAHNGVLKLGIPSDGELSPMARVCNSSLPPFPALEHLNICESQYGLRWQVAIEDAQWLELLHPFITVKSLYLDKKLAPRVARALQELTEDSERVTEMLPALQNVFVQGPVHPAIVQFISVRQRLGHPVALQDWDGELRY